MNKVASIAPFKQVTSITSHLQQTKGVDKGRRRGRDDLILSQWRKNHQLSHNIGDHYCLEMFRGNILANKEGLLNEATGKKAINPVERKYRNNILRTQEREQQGNHQLSHNISHQLLGSQHLEVTFQEEPSTKSQQHLAS